MQVPHTGAQARTDARTNTHTHVINKCKRNVFKVLKPWEVFSLSLEQSFLCDRGFWVTKESKSSKAGDVGLQRAPGPLVDVVRELPEPQLCRNS